MHAKLNELITNLNAHVRIWMLEKTLPGTVANLNALDAYLNLNDVNAKFLDRSANLNDRNTNLNYGFHGPDLFREFEWLLHQIEWQICEIDRENLLSHACHLALHGFSKFYNSRSIVHVHFCCEKNPDNKHFQTTEQLALCLFVCALQITDASIQLLEYSSFCIVRNIMHNVKIVEIKGIV